MIRTFPCWFALVMLCMPMTARADEPQGEAPAKGSVESSEDTSATLSVAPLDHVHYPADRPGWIDDEPVIDDESASIVAYSGVHDSVEAASDMLEVMTTAAVETIVRQRIDSRPNRLDPDDIRLDPKWIQDRLVVRRYNGLVTIGGEAKHESAVLLRLDGDENEVIDLAIRNATVAERLAVLGVFGVGGLVSLLTGSIVFNGVSRHQSRRKRAAASPE